MWLSFIVFGLTIAAAVWIFERRTLGRVMRLIGVAALVLLAVLVLFFISGSQTLGPAPWWRRSPWWQVSLFVVMVGGMTCRYMTQLIEERRARLAAGRARGSIRFDMWEFSYPLFVSVITFGSLLSVLQAEAFNLPNALLSFQTGFFWQTVLQAKSVPSSSLPRPSAQGAE